MDVSHDPTLSTQASVIIKFWHALDGLYVWEFITTLDYEWKVIRGRLPYRWTIWIYSLTRLAALVGVILCLTGMDVTTSMDCQIWITFSAALIYLSAAAASLLIVLRIIAIWNRNKAVMRLSISVWIISTVFHIGSAAQLRAVWAPTQHICELVNTKPSVISYIPVIVSNLVLLSIMLVGLLILRRHGCGTSGLSHVLWKQAVIWLALAIVTEIPPLVLMVVNLNNDLDIMLDFPCLITMIITATRMHRYLIDFASKTGKECQNPPRSLVFAERTKQTDTTPSTLSQIEVTAHTAFEQHDDYLPDMRINEQGFPTGSTSDDDSPIISMNEHMSQIVHDSPELDV